MNRRAAQTHCRRGHHHPGRAKDRRAVQARMRYQNVIRQEWESSSQGPNDSPRAQAPQKAQKARKA